MKCQDTSCRQEECGTCRVVWDLAAPAGAGAASALHLAAAAGDGGAAAGLLLARCPDAGALWTSLRDAGGQTPQDVADGCALPPMRELPGPQELPGPLSPNPTYSACSSGSPADSASCSWCED
jgi:hypothetical protein